MEGENVWQGTKVRKGKDKAFIRPVGDFRHHWESGRRGHVCERGALMVANALGIHCSIVLFCTCIYGTHETIFSDGKFSTFRVERRGSLSITDT